MTGVKIANNDVAVCRFSSVLFLWHINHYRLFNAKSSSYIYIKYIGFGLFWFYGISTIVGYLMPNFVYTYILDIYMIGKHIL